MFSNLHLFGSSVYILLHVGQKDQHVAVITVKVLKVNTVFVLLLFLSFHTSSAFVTNTQPCFRSKLWVITVKSFPTSELFSFATCHHLRRLFLLMQAGFTRQMDRDWRLAWTSTAQRDICMHPSPVKQLLPMVKRCFTGFPWSRHTDVHE